MAEYKLPGYKKLLDTICNTEDDITVVGAMMLACQLYVTGNISINQMYVLINSAADQFYLFNTDD